MTCNYSNTRRTIFVHSFHISDLLEYLPTPKGLIHEVIRATAYSILLPYLLIGGYRDLMAIYPFGSKINRR